MTADEPARASTPGERIKRLRERRGLLQAAVANRVGKSGSWLSMIESGQRDLSSWPVVCALSEVLGCEPTDIFGHPAEHAPNGRREHPSAAGARAALDRWPAVAALSGEPDADALGVLVRDAWLRYQRSPGRLDEAGARLPGMVDAVQATVHALDGDARREAQRHAALAWQLSRSWFKRIGEFADASRCADRAIAAAQEAGDLPLVVAGMWNLALVYGPQGEHEVARDVARRGAAALRPLLAVDPTPEALSAYGGMHLVDSIMSARLGDQGAAWDALSVADRVARRTGDRNDFYTVFGPTNVRVWSVAVASDLGLPGEALRYARDVGDTSGMPSIERRFSHEVEVARCHRQSGNDEATLFSLLTAESTCPSEAAYSVGMREMTRALLRRENRLTHRAKLRGLAGRLGVLDVA